MHKILPAAAAGAALGIVLTGCAMAVPGTPAPIRQSVPTTAPLRSASPRTTVPPGIVTTVVPAPSTVVVTSPQALTRCQEMYAQGLSYSTAFSEWVAAGSPASWDADHDGYPCEQTYGDQN